MQHNPGAPAFDNIDDLLAEKIVNHSRKHSDHPQPRQPLHHQHREQYAATSPGTGKQGKPATHSFTRYALVILIIISISILFLLTRTFRNS
jgi:hypothetical protein